MCRESQDVAAENDRDSGLFESSDYLQPKWWDFGWGLVAASDAVHGAVADPVDNAVDDALDEAVDDTVVDEVDGAVIDWGWGWVWEDDTDMTEVDDDNGYAGGGQKLVQNQRQLLQSRTPCSTSPSARTPNQEQLSTLSQPALELEGPAFATSNVFGGRGWARVLTPEAFAADQDFAERYCAGINIQFNYLDPTFGVPEPRVYDNGLLTPKPSFDVVSPLSPTLAVQSPSDIGGSYGNALEFQTRDLVTSPSLSDSPAVFSLFFCSADSCDDVFDRQCDLK